MEAAAIQGRNPQNPNGGQIGAARGKSDYVTLGLRCALFLLAGATGARAGAAQTAAQAARAAAGGAGASRRGRESQGQGVLVQSAAGEQGVAGRHRVLQEA